MKESEPIKVECYSGNTYAQRPRAVYLNGVRFLVDDILREWKTPEGRSFRVRVGDREITISYLEEQDIWIAGTD
jgi:hypothetical protein